MQSWIYTYEPETTVVSIGFRRWKNPTADVHHKIPQSKQPTTFLLIKEQNASVLLEDCRTAVWAMYNHLLARTLWINTDTQTIQDHSSS